MARQVKREEIADARGRIWSIAVVPTELAQTEDTRFWAEELTPEQRVNAVHDCLVSSLKAKGVTDVPRLRRVARIVQCDRG